MSSVKRGRGRPHQYSDARALAVARRIAAGDTLQVAADATSIPVATIKTWAKDPNDRFRRLLFAACWIGVTPALDASTDGKPDAELRRDIEDVAAALEKGDVNFLVCSFADTQKNSAMLKFVLHNGAGWVARFFADAWNSTAQLKGWQREVAIKEARAHGWVCDVMIRVLSGGAPVTNRELARIRDILVPGRDPEIGDGFDLAEPA